jgi:hypothetical protein
LEAGSGERAQRRRVAYRVIVISVKRQWKCKDGRNEEVDGCPDNSDDFGGFGVKRLYEPENLGFSEDGGWRNVKSSAWKMGKMVLGRKWRVP